MLRIQRYDVARHDIQSTFQSIFPPCELPYLKEVKSCDPSYVALDRHGVVQAFILTQLTPDDITDYEIAYLGVLPRYRKQGFGERLITLVLEGVGSAGVWLKVMKSNEGACRLYERMGFNAAEEFCSEDGEIGITWICGVEYECASCLTRLKPSETRWEYRIVGYEMSTYGLRGIPQLKPVCVRCETRVEP